MSRCILTTSKYFLIVSLIFLKRFSENRAFGVTSEPLFELADKKGQRQTTGNRLWPPAAAWPVALNADRDSQSVLK